MNIETAYEIIAKGCVHKAGGCTWDRIILKVEIGERMTTEQFWTVSDEEKYPAIGSIPREMKIPMVDAELFLRDDLLKTTGDRIWGFVFTLHKEGRFEIAYDYKMPDGYNKQIL